MTPVVLKFGGELLEEPARLNAVVAAVGRIAGGSVPMVRVVPVVPMVIVHGGGKEIDGALRAAGIEKRQVDGLRITDRATLEVVVSILAGTVNTRLVAALTSAGVAAVGLTGADGSCGLCEVAPPHQGVSGGAVDLGLVGLPTDAADVRLLETLLRDGFVPVLASIGIDDKGQLLNVNADTMAGYVAARMRARRLVIAGSTRGVLGEDGATLPLLGPSDIQRLVAQRTATAGMVAKLRACEQALAGGVDDVVILDGTDGAAIEAAALGTMPAAATRIVTTAGMRR